MSSDKTNARYLLVHSTDLDTLVPEGEKKVVTSPQDEARQELLRQTLVVEKRLLDGDGKLAEADATIRETWATMETTHCKSLVEWSTALKAAKELDHLLFSCDDPRSRNIGFVDHTANKVFYIGLTRFAQAAPEDWAAAGMSRDDFKSGQGRASLMSGDSTFEYQWDQPPISEEEAVHLQGLVDEMCADIDREFAQEVPVLDLAIPRPERPAPDLAVSPSSASEP